MADEPDNLRAGGSGGSAASAGIQFQKQLGALIGSWMLTGRPVDQRFNLGAATVVWLRFETEAPVDDILVATSAGGFIAIQAKTTASLSRNLNSPFGKTVTQFVRHWLATRDGDGKRHWNRPLDPVRDRLVLAVGREAPENIRQDLPAALRLRSQPGGAVLNRAQKRAFEDFEACVAQAWHASTTDDYDAALPTTLASLISIFVFDPFGSDRELILSRLGDATTRQGDAPTALTALEAVSEEMMVRRGGADISALRLSLQTKGVKLQAAPQYQADIATLQAHSEAVALSLRRYEVIEVADRDPVSIPRDCQEPLLQAALIGSLLIVGEPGAGKSGVLNALARDLREKGNDVLELAVDQYSVETLEGLQKVLRLGYPLLEVLNAWDGTQPGWLIIDALDATRGGRGEGVFRTLIEQVLGRRGRWHVVASIRTFDLRMGQQFRSLFKGSPPLQDLQEPGFSLVRHVRVPTWSAGEFERLLDSASALSAALANAPKVLRDLAMVPFNTRLLSDLVKDGLVTADFTHVASHAELLQLYWNHRVGPHGTAARACVKRIVEAMVATRALRASIDAASGSDPSIIDQLGREGVIISVDNGRWIQFRHHLLFDFAAARVLLDPDAIVAGTLRFRKEEARGLMLAPALTFVLREIWERNEDRADFWTAAVAILADAESDPIIRSATGRICAEYPLVPLDTRCLGARIVAHDGLAAKAFGHIAGGLAVRLEDYPQSPIPPWVELLRTISSNFARVVGTFRFLLFRLTSIVKDESQRRDLGIAARAMLNYGYSNNFPRDLVSSAISLVADTFATDPGRSQMLLANVFEPTRLLAYASEEVPALARKIALIAAENPVFAADIYRETYAWDVTEERKTPLGHSQIVSMTSNARQDYGMARYALGEFMPIFLRDHPDEAVIAIVGAVEACVVREHPIAPKLGNHTLTIAGRRVRLREDRSHIWAYDPNSTYGEGAELLVKKLVLFLRGADEAAVLHIASSLIDTASLAIFWARLFMVAVERNDALIGLLFPFAAEEAFLINPDTRKDSIDVVARGYGSLSTEQRETFEHTVQALDFSGFHMPDGARDRFLRRLFGSIGSDSLATASAAAFATTEADGDVAQNDRLFVVQSSVNAVEEYSWIEDLDRNLPSNHLLIVAIDAAKTALGIDQVAKAADDGSAAPGAIRSPDILSNLTALANTVRRGEQNSSLVSYAESMIGQGLGRLVSLNRVPNELDANGTAQFMCLLSLLSAADDPALTEDSEANFERSPSWSSPAPRVEAAQVTLDLALQRPDLYSTLRPMIDALLVDQHPAVRLQAGLRLVRIWDLDRAGFWNMLAARLEAEKNESVLIHLISAVLGRVLHEDPVAAEPIIAALLHRFLGDRERQARMRKTLADLVSVLWVKFQRDFAREILDGWVAEPETYQDELSRILDTMRDAIVAGLGGDASAAGDALRRRSLDLTMKIVESASSGLEAYFERQGPSQEDKDVAAGLAQLLDDACRAIYFGTGASAGRDGDESSRPISDEALAVIFVETASILTRIGDCGTPHTIYYLLQLLEFLLPVDPERAFDLTARALRGGGQRTGYQFELLGADLLVRLIGVFLADHKELFERDDRRAALIDCLEIFVEAGWPKAQRLLYHLPELIQ